MASASSRNENDICEKVENDFYAEFLTSCGKKVRDSGELYVDYLKRIGGDQEYIKRWLKKFEEAVEDSTEGCLIDMKNLHDKMSEQLEKRGKKLEDLQMVLKITPDESPVFNRSLTSRLENVSSKIEILETQLQTREKNVKLLQDKLLLLSRKMEVSFDNIPTTYSPKSVDNLQKKVENLEEQFVKKEQQVLTKKNQIKEILTNCEILLEESTEFEFLEIDNESFKVTDCVVNKIDEIYTKVKETEDQIMEETEALKTKLKFLWKVLEIPIEEQIDFLHSLKEKICVYNIKKLTTETAKLENIRMQNLSDLIDQQRTKLENMWDVCLCGYSIRNEFPLFYSPVVNVEVLDTFFNEVQKWHDYYLENKEIIVTVDSFNKCSNQLKELELNVDKEKLYKNRGGLMRIELQKQNSLKKKMKKYEETLLQLSEDYLKKFNRKFLIFDESVETFINKSYTNIKISNDGYPSPVKEVKKTPSSKLGSPFTSSRKTPNSAKSTNQKLQTLRKTSSRVPKFKLNDSKSIKKASVWKPSRVSLNAAKKKDEEDSWSEFEKDVKESVPRSSSIYEIKE